MVTHWDTSCVVKLTCRESDSDWYLEALFPFSAGSVPQKARLYANPDVWGQGVGRSLLDHAIRGLRSLGRPEVSLWVLHQNHRGIKFYQKFGFEPVSGSEKRSDLGGRKVEEICLRLQPETTRVPSTASP